MDRFKYNNELRENICTQFVDMKAPIRYKCVVRISLMNYTNRGFRHD